MYPQTQSKTSANGQRKKKGCKRIYLLYNFSFSETMLLALLDGCTWFLCVPHLRLPLFFFNPLSTAIMVDLFVGNFCWTFLSIHEQRHCNVMLYSIKFIFSLHCWLIQTNWELTKRKTLPASQYHRNILQMWMDNCISTFDSYMCDFIDKWIWASNYCLVFGLIEIWNRISIRTSSFANRSMEMTRQNDDVTIYPSNRWLNLIYTKNYWLCFSVQNRLNWLRMRHNKSSIEIEIRMQRKRKEEKIDAMRTMWASSHAQCMNVVIRWMQS